MDDTMFESTGVKPNQTVRRDNLTDLSEKILTDKQRIGDPDWVDPEMRFDFLPQPYRLIQKCVDKVVEDAWSFISQFNIQERKEPEIMLVQAQKTWVSTKAKEFWTKLSSAGDRHSMYMANASGKVTKVDTHSKANLCNFLPFPHLKAITHIGVSTTPHHHHNELLAVSNDGEIGIFWVKGHSSVHHLFHVKVTTPPTSLQMSGDHRYLAMTGEDKSVRVYALPEIIKSPDSLEEGKEIEESAEQGESGASSRQNPTLTPDTSSVVLVDESEVVFMTFPETQEQAEDENEDGEPKPEKKDEIPPVPHFHFLLVEDPRRSVIQETVTICRHMVCWFEGKNILHRVNLERAQAAKAGEGEKGEDENGSAAASWKEDLNFPEVIVCSEASEDFSTVAIGLVDGSIITLASSAGLMRDRTIFAKLSHPITSLSFCPNKDILCTSNGNVLLLNISTGETLGACYSSELIPGFRVAQNVMSLPWVIGLNTYGKLCLLDRKDMNVLAILGFESGHTSSLSDGACPSSCIVEMHLIGDKLKVLYIAPNSKSTIAVFSLRATLISLFPHLEEFISQPDSDLKALVAIYENRDNQDALTFLRDGPGLDVGVGLLARDSTAAKVDNPALKLSYLRGRNDVVSTPGSTYSGGAPSVGSTRSKRTATATIPARSISSRSSIGGASRVSRRTGQTGKKTIATAPNFASFPKQASSEKGDVSVVLSHLQDRTKRRQERTDRAAARQKELLSKLQEDNAKLEQKTRESRRHGMM